MRCNSCGRGNLQRSCRACKNGDLQKDAAALWCRHCMDNFWKVHVGFRHDRPVISPNVASIGSRDPDVHCNVCRGTLLPGLWVTAIVPYSSSRRANYTRNLHKMHVAAIAHAHTSPVYSRLVSCRGCFIDIIWLLVPAVQPLLSILPARRSGFQMLHTQSMNSSSPRPSGLDPASDQRRRHHCLSAVPDCQPSVIELFRSRCSYLERSAAPCHVHTISDSDRCL